jgi:replication factor C subunit 3/5
MLWVDKHRPSKLEDLSYHDNITERLQSLTANPDAMPHLFFYGPAGSGKKTRITALLRSLYGPGAERLKLDRRTFTTPTKRTVEINMITSNCKSFRHVVGATLSSYGILSAQPYFLFRSHNAVPG